MWDSLKEEPKIAAEKAKQPEGISRELKSFQLEGLNWMVKQEQTKWKGGLLGDEMGMGKTIQAVSLIMSDFPAKTPTLVVVPPVALMQWQNEITDYTNGTLKVLVYHGTNAKVKGLKKKDLMKYNVIMISCKWHVLIIIEIANTHKILDSNPCIEKSKKAGHAKTRMEMPLSSRKIVLCILSIGIVSFSTRRITSR
jgi:SNF2 family DNA or RNA helicase